MSLIAAVLSDVAVSVSRSANIRSDCRSTVSGVGGSAPRQVADAAPGLIEPVSGQATT